MAGAFIIVLREVIEAGLIIGIVLAATKALPGRGVYVAAGIGAGLFGALLLAVFAGSLSNALSGVGQEVFNASVLAIAVLMLGWHNVWMARHGREISEDMRRLGRDVTSGARSLAALAVVVAVAVLREGAEVVLFLYGIALSSHETGSALLAGGLLGVGGGAALSALTYRGLAVLPPRLLFRFTSALIAFMAAGMAAQSVAFLEQADLATRLSRVVWDSGWLLPDDSLPGRVLHTLVGYTSSPTQLEVVVYLLTLGAILGLMRLAAPPARAAHRLASH